MAVLSEGVVVLVYGQWTAWARDRRYLKRRSSFFQHWAASFAPPIIQPLETNIVNEAFRTQDEDPSSWMGQGRSMHDALFEHLFTCRCWHAVWQQSHTMLFWDAGFIVSCMGALAHTPTPGT